VAHPDGTGLTRLTDNKAQYTFPPWSSARQKFAVVSGNMGDSNLLYLMDYDGSNLSLLVSDSSIALISYLAWSPDGRYLVFAARNSTSNFDLYKVTGPGLNAGLVRLTNTASMSETWPHWSPDSSKIAFQTQTITQSGTLASSTWGIEVINADGTGRHALLQGYGGG
jgi:Tol biopolymer transport system component